MRCLYCGKELALLKRWTGGGEFCSDAHRQRYQAEYNELALKRLLQAKPPEDKRHQKSKTKEEIAATRTQAPERANGLQGPPPLPSNSQAAVARIPEPVLPSGTSSETSIGLSDSGGALAAPSGTTMNGTLNGILNNPAEGSRSTAVAYQEPGIQEPSYYEAANPPVPEAAAELSAEVTGTLDALKEPRPLGAMLVDLPSPVRSATASTAASTTDFLQTAEPPSIPRGHFDAMETKLITAGPAVLESFRRILDCTERLREGRLESRDFVRSAPVAEFNLHSVAAQEIKIAERPMDVRIEACRPHESPAPWQASEKHLAHFELNLGTLGRMCFRTTGLRDNEESYEVSESLPASVGASFGASPITAVVSEEAAFESIGAGTDAPVETTAAKEVQEQTEAVFEPELVDSHSEPAVAEVVEESVQESAYVVQETVPEVVQETRAPVEPHPADVVPDVVSEVVAEIQEAIPAASLASRSGESPSAENVSVEALAEPEVLEISSPETTTFVPETASPEETAVLPAAFVPEEASAKEDPPAQEQTWPTEQASAHEQTSAAQDLSLEDETSVAEEAAVLEETSSSTIPVVPELASTPMPLPIHSLVPGKAKPVRAFHAAASISTAIQVPRSEGFPLRPLMVLGPAPVEEPMIEDRLAAAETAKSATTQLVPAKTDSKTTDSTKTGVTKADPARTDPTKTGPTRADPGTQSSNANRGGGAKARKSQRASEPRGQAQEEPSAQQAATKEALRDPEPSLPGQDKSKRKARDPLSAPVESPGAADLGLPILPERRGLWSRIPGPARIGLAAALLAVVVAFYYSTMRPEQAPAAAAPRPVVTEPALTVTPTGWIDNFSPDAKQSRQISILRPSLTLTNFRMEFQGVIENKALGWVFRARDPKDFYVMKLETTEPGVNPKVAFVRFAVTNGEEQPRKQIPLPLPVKRDTRYEVRLEAMGSHFTTWVQGQKVDEWTDTNISAGGVGFYNERGERGRVETDVRVFPLVVQ